MKQKYSGHGFNIIGVKLDRQKAAGENTDLLIMRKKSVHLFCLHYRENACTARNVETAGPVLLLLLLHAIQCRKSKTDKTETKYKAARRE